MTGSNPGGATEVSELVRGDVRNAVERSWLLPNHSQLGFEAPPKNVLHRT